MCPFVSGSRSRSVPTWWGGLPFLALPDDKNGLMPRYEGKWAEMGARQSETYRGWPHHFYLWAWENRDPDRVIESRESRTCRPEVYRRCNHIRVQRRSAFSSQRKARGEDHTTAAGGCWETVHAGSGRGQGGSDVPVSSA